MRRALYAVQACAVILPLKLTIIPTAARGVWQAATWLATAPQRQIEATLAERQERLYQSYYRRHLATS
jgi:hypothetical protein